MCWDDRAANTCTTFSGATGKGKTHRVLLTFYLYVLHNEEYLVPTSGVQNRKHDKGRFSIVKVQAFSTACGEMTPELGTALRI